MHGRFRKRVGLNVAQNWIYFGLVRCQHWLSTSAMNSCLGQITIMLFSVQSIYGLTVHGEWSINDCFTANQRDTDACVRLWLSFNNHTSTCWMRFIRTSLIAAMSSVVRTECFVSILGISSIFQCSVGYFYCSELHNARTTVLEQLPYPSTRTSIAHRWVCSSSSMRSAWKLVDDVKSSFKSTTFEPQASRLNWCM
jgi:hypothetical protein